MSQITRCDGCGEPAPPNYNSIIPPEEWMHVNGRYLEDQWDVCSWDCLATLVAATSSEQATA